MSYAGVKFKAFEPIQLDNFDGISGLKVVKSQYAYFTTSNGYRITCDNCSLCKSSSEQYNILCTSTSL